MNNFLKEKMNAILVLIIIVITFAGSLAIMLKYKKEGEKNMPFEIKKIFIISSAEAANKSDTESNNKWNFNINQYNDIYITFEKNEDYQKSTYINNISLENINIEKSKKGKIELYRPCEEENKMFKYDSNFLIDDSIIFKGESSDNMKELKIANDGGTIVFRVLNSNVGEYVSDEDDEIHYDASLLKKAGIKTEDIETKISFDIVIDTNKSKYRGRMEINLPNENINEEGVAQRTIEDFDNIIFKRERR